MQFQNLRNRADGSIEGRYLNEQLESWVSFHAEEGSQLWTFLHAEPDAVQQLTQQQAQPVPTYSTLKEARAAMAAWIDGFLTEITGPVPQYERESWPAKAEAARATIAGNARPDQLALLDAEAGASSRTRDQLVAVIVARADAYEIIIGQTAGLRVTLDNELAAESDPHKYEAILESGKTRAAALATTLGIEIAQ